MDDREIVVAIAAGDPAGLADAYDRYAESLYGYCRWMLSEPEDATDALQDTFVVAAARLGGLRDPRKLRPWLYAVARNECYRRLRTVEEAGLDEAAGLADPSADAGASAEQAELRRLVRAALDGLNPAEREVIELGLRHDLQGADLAAVLGVPRNQAHALASRARGQLEKALGALLVARTGRRACPELDMLLDGWDGRRPGRCASGSAATSTSAMSAPTAGAARCGLRHCTAWPRWPRSLAGCARRCWSCAPTSARCPSPTGGTWRKAPGRSGPAASRSQPGRPGRGCSRWPGSRRRRGS